jgi:hypothetical protein
MWCFFSGGVGAAYNGGAPRACVLRFSEIGGRVKGVLFLRLVREGLGRRV